MGAKSAPIAVTGGIATGKSTVCKVLREMGRTVASSDEIAREVFEEPEVQQELEGILGLPLPLDRSKVREKISVSPTLRRKVNSLLHPRIRTRIEALQVEFVEVPLAVETCLLDSFSEIWLAWCDAPTQKDRLSRLVPNEFDRIQWLATQLPLDVKVPFADAIIRTNRSIEAVRYDIANLLREQSARNVASNSGT